MIPAGGYTDRLPEGPRGMKMRVDQQSKIACLPNSLTLQREPEIKKSKSCHVLKSYDVLNPLKKEQRNLILNEKHLPQYDAKNYALRTAKPRQFPE